MLTEVDELNRIIDALQNRYIHEITNLKISIAQLTVERDKYLADINLNPQSVTKLRNKLRIAEGQLKCIVSSTSSASLSHQYAKQALEIINAN